MTKGNTERRPNPTEDFLRTTEEASYVSIDQSPGFEAMENVAAEGAEEEMPPKADQEIDPRPLAQRFSEKGE